MKLAIIVPALNEEAYLGQTLDSVQTAARLLRARCNVDVQTIVVDNNSEDDTAAVALTKGATVIREPLRNIARARNAGARQCTADVLVFVDADVVLPPTALNAIHATMSDPKCVGGGLEVEYHPRRFWVRLYLGAWRLLARATGMVQGAAQFSRRCAFEQVGGYNESVWIGEDVDFCWGLKKLARDSRRTIRLIETPRARPSCRRFDQWPVWKILVWTNPLFIAVCRRWRPMWKGWYADLVR